jgi:hypothetical protein
MKRFIYIFSLLVFSYAVKAQSVVETDSVYYFRTGKGVVKTDASPQVESFMTGMKTAEYTPTGFRVQLTSESGQGSQDRAKDVKARFLSNYKDINSYLVWEAPNFKIRVGDFRTKFEAAMFWKQIQAEFPNSYIVEDKINPGGKRR